MPRPRRLAPCSISRRLISPFTKRVVKSRPFSYMGLSSPSVLLGLLGLAGFVPGVDPPGVDSPGVDPIDDGLGSVFVGDKAFDQPTLQHRHDRLRLVRAAG